MNELDQFVTLPPIYPKTSVNLVSLQQDARDTLQKFLEIAETSDVFKNLKLNAVYTYPDKVLLTDCTKIVEVSISYFADYETEVNCTEGYEFVVKHYGSRVCNKTIRARTYKDLLKAVAGFLSEW